MDRDRWPEVRARFAAIFASKTREEWCRLFEGVEACFAPVLSVAEAVEHPHQKQRNGFVQVDGVTHPAPAPRFSRTPARISCPPPEPGSDTSEVLRDWNFSDAEIGALRNDGIIA